MLIEFPNRTVIVTGGGHGFGRAIAQGFAERGARVWVCDLNDTALAETCAPNAAYRHAIQGSKVDVGNREQVGAFVAEVEKATGGPVGVLVNNAGGVRGQVGRPLEEISLTDWKVIYEANVDGAFWFSQAAAPGMKAAKSGRIVNISSGAGLGVSLTGIQAYASAKAASIGLTRQLCHELGPFGITVNCIAPGFIRSNPSTEKQWESYGPEGQRALMERIAMRRPGSPDDIAHAVMFFASDYAGWVSGQILSVDGGK